MFRIMFFVSQLILDLILNKFIGSWKQISEQIVGSHRFKVNYFFFIFFKSNYMNYLSGSHCFLNLQSIAGFSWWKLCVPE